MKRACGSLLLLLLAGCARPAAPPLEEIGRFDGELAQARGKRRVVALVSPT